MASQISLGFTDQSFEPGVHICQIFNSDSERQDSLQKFLLSGLQTGEQTVCFSEKVDEKILADFFYVNRITYDEVKNSGAFALSSVNDVYFQNGKFDPDRMLDLLKNYYDGSVEQGYPAARVIGEMSSDVQNIEGGSRLMEYESRVSIFLREHPLTAVCQYDANTFSGSMIMDILKVHPLMIVRGAVVQNPFYISPEEVLSTIYKN